MLGKNNDINSLCSFLKKMESVSRGWLMAFTPLCWNFVVFAKHTHTHTSPSSSFQFVCLSPECGIHLTFFLSLFALPQNVISSAVCVCFFFLQPLTKPRYTENVQRWLKVIPEKRKRGGEAKKKKVRKRISPHKQQATTAKSVHF